MMEQAVDVMMTSEVGDDQADRSGMVARDHDFLATLLANSYAELMMMMKKTKLKAHCD